MSTMKERMIRAAKLDTSLYEEVEADASTFPQAMGVVALSSLAGGLGGVWAVGFKGIIWGTITALIAWYVWAYITYFIGTKLIPEPETEADHGQLLRTIGFASSPGIIRILGIIPGVYHLAHTVAGIWMLITTIIAVRQALDYKSTARAIVVCIAGWVVQMAILWIFYAVAGR